MNNSLLKNTVYKLILNIFNICVPIIVSPYILRVIGPESLGKINYAESIYTYFFAFASAGIYQYGIREVAKYRDNKEKLADFFTNCFVITLIGSFTVLVIYLIFIFNTQELNYIKLILLVYGFNIASNIFYVEWANEGFENFKFITIKTVLIRSIYILGIFTFVKVQDDYINYVILNTLFILFNNIISYVYIKRNIGFNFKNLNIRSHIKFLIAGFIICNYGILFYQVDKTMLGYYGTDIDVSLYSVSNMIMFMILTMIQTILTVSIPRLVKSMNNDENEYNNLLSKLYKVYCMFTFPSAIGLMILSNYILLFYGGSQYLQANISLKLFSFFLIVINIEMFIRNQILYVNGKEKVISKFLIISGLFNIIGNYIFINKTIYKSEVAITITIISILILLLLEYIYVLKFINVKFKIVSIDIFKYVFSSLLFIPVYMILSKVMEKGIILFLSTITSCIVVYFTALLILKDEFIYRIYKEISSYKSVKKIENKKYI